MGVKNAHRSCPQTPYFHPAPRAPDVRAPRHRRVSTIGIGRDRKPPGLRRVAARLRSGKDRESQASHQKRANIRDTAVRSPRIRLGRGRPSLGAQRESAFRSDQPGQLYGQPRLARYLADADCERVGGHGEAAGATQSPLPRTRGLPRSLFEGTVPTTRAQLPQPRNVSTSSHGGVYVAEAIRRAANYSRYARIAHRIRSNRASSGTIAP